MIYIGTAGAPTDSATTEDGVKRVRKLGLHAMEVEFVQGVRMSVGHAKRVGETARGYDVRLSCHAPYYINLNSEKEEVIGKSIERILRTAERAHHMGAVVIVVHAGYYSKKTSEEATEVIIEGVRECAEKVSDNNWEVLIGLETTGKKAQWGKFHEIGRVCRSVKGVIPVVDFGHIHAVTGGGLRTEEDFENVFSTYESIHGGFMHAHFSCINYTDKGERNHLTLDAKEPDYELIVPAIKKRNYDITLISESPILEKDALKMKRLLG